MTTMLLEDPATQNGTELLNNLLNTPVKIDPAANVPAIDLYNQLTGSKRRDFAAPMDKMVITRDMPSSAREQDQYSVLLGEQYAFGMSAFAVKQLNQKLSKGFGSYADELNSRGMHELYLKNVNELLDTEERQAMIRVLSNGSDYARAVVSDKYAQIDDPLVFGAAFAVLEDHLHKFKPIGGNRTDIRTYCKFVSRQPLFEMEIGGKTRAFSAGFIISNSEVGQGNAMFQAFFTDSYCDNGIIFSKEVIADCKFKHIGSKISTQFGEILGKQVENCRQAEIHDFITEATKLAVLQDPKMLDPIKAQIIRSSERKLGGGVVGELDSVRNVLKEVGIAKNDMDNIIRELDPADNSQFGVQAAVTQFAQKAESYEKRIELEQRGGEIVILNDKKWGALQAS